MKLFLLRYSLERWQLAQQNINFEDMKLLIVLKISYSIHYRSFGFQMLFSGQGILMSIEILCFLFSQLFEFFITQFHSNSGSFPLKSHEFQGEI